MARPSDDADDLAADTVVELRLPDGRTLTTNDPASRAMFACLMDRWPLRSPFAEVVAEVRHLLTRAGRNPPDGAQLGRELAVVVLECFPSRFIEAHVHSPSMAGEPSRLPQASPLARLQAARGSLRVTNLVHVVAELNPLHRVVLPLLDGTRDRTAILDAMAAAAEHGKLNVQEEGQPVRDADRARALLSTTIEPALAQLANMALLVA
jgi:hypothetical protein